MVKFFIYQFCCFFLLKMQSLASSSISLLLKIKKRSRWTQPISVIKPNPT